MGREERRVEQPCYSLSLSSTVAGESGGLSPVTSSDHSPVVKVGLTRPVKLEQRKVSGCFTDWFIIAIRRMLGNPRSFL